MKHPSIQLWFAIKGNPLPSNHCVLQTSYKQIKSCASPKSISSIRFDPELGCTTICWCIDSQGSSCGSAAVTILCDSLPPCSQAGSTTCVAFREYAASAAEFGRNMRVSSRYLGSVQGSPLQAPTQQIYRSGAWYRYRRGDETASERSPLGHADEQPG